MFDFAPPPLPIPPPASADELAAVVDDDDGGGGGGAAVALSGLRCTVTNDMLRDWRGGGAIKR